VNLAVATDQPSLEGSVTERSTPTSPLPMSRMACASIQWTPRSRPISIRRARRRGYRSRSIAGEYHNAVADTAAGSDRPDITATGNGTLAFADSGSRGSDHASTSHLETIGDVVKQPFTGIATVDAVVGGNGRQFVANGTLTYRRRQHQEHSGSRWRRSFRRGAGSRLTQTTVTADKRRFVDIPACKERGQGPY
jgi:hypothetical protein